MEDVNKTELGLPKKGSKQAGLPVHYSPHSFRATGITNFLENDEHSWRPPSESPAMPTVVRQSFMTRRGQKVLLEDMERIRY